MTVQYTVTNTSNAERESYVPQNAYFIDARGNALNTLDLPIVMGAVLVIAVMFIVINILIDILYGILDPRVRIK